MFDNKSKSPGKKGTIFNIDEERRQIKVPFKPPRTFTTTNKLAMTNSQGTGLIGALTADGKGYFRRPAPRGETEAIIRRRFNNNSSYAMTFAQHGRLPTTNKRPDKGFVAAFGKIKEKTAY